MVGVLGAFGMLALLSGALLLVAGAHLTQGTSGLGLGDLWALVGGAADGPAGATREILIGSRVPRLAAGVAVGVALGVAGALLQSLTRNSLASPDTLAVTAGSYLAVVAVAAFGLSVPLWASGAVAFAGGLAAAVLVIGLSGAGTATTRILLAGSAVALALQAATTTLLILFSQNTTSLFAWGSGSLSQLGLTAFLYAAPVVLAATGLGLLLARRLDLMALGDDTAAVMGVPVRSTRIVGIGLAVVLTAAAVTLAGPIGFVGLCAPVIVRLLGRFVPGLNRHAVLIPASGLVGALLVITADVVVRALFGAEAGIAIPTGVVTTIAGAAVLVLLARRLRDAGPTRRPPTAGVGVRRRRRFLLVLLAGVALAGGTLLVGLLVGNTMLRTGDIALWVNGQGPPVVRFALDERAPRVLAAMVAGGAIALAGVLAQATCRNPLAEPGLLGITAGAGLGAVIVVTAGAFGTEGSSNTAILTAAMTGALVAFGVVYGLTWRGGLSADRLVLVGIGVWYGASAVTTLLLLRTNAWDTPRIYTWLSGTTYGRTFEQILPVAIALAVGLPLALLLRRELDLLALDEDTPRLVGVRLEPVRLTVLLLAVVLAATSVAAVGVVGFLGLVAPHAARALVGGRHARVIPVAVLLGAVLLGSADAFGRWVIAPAQIPAGLTVALIGAPYFVYLLARSRVRT
ncbi:iron ABC transporter permease [Nakamurella sp.]|uniref:iron ABC transporter permease n=1 Tax=Nakamurella sp. TaxID=1869182 RepID=UPI0037830BD8